jgi:multidrug efflux pump subunit AcrA (membrane-fusion protein)
MIRRHRLAVPRRFFCRIGLLAVGLAASMLSASGCSEKEKNAVTSVSEPPTVRVTNPKPRRIVRVVGQPSFVESYERTSIYPKVTGYIEKWYVDIGDDVKKGQVLADLFVPEIREDYQTKGATVELTKRQIELAQTEVKVTQADVIAADARLGAAKAILEKYEALVDRWDSEVKRLSRETKSGVIDRQVLDESKNQLRGNVAARAAAQADIEKAAADLEAAKATERKSEVSVDVARANLDVAKSDWKRMEAWVGYLKLYAPFDGRIVARNANTGDFVKPMIGDPSADNRAPHLSPSGTSAPIYVVDRTDVVRIFVDIPEHDANYVKEGSKATVMIRAFRDRLIPATVTRTSWALNVKSRTLRAEIDLHNSETPEVYRDRGEHQLDNVKPGTKVQILPGMYAYSKVIIDRPDVMALPEAALMRQGERTFCWRCENGRAVRTEIEIGITDGEWVEVTNRQAPPAAKGDADPWVPFDGSEQVILGDLSILTDGAAVNVAAAAEKGAAPAAGDTASEPPRR